MILEAGYLLFSVYLGGGPSLMWDALHCELYPLSSRMPLRGDARCWFNRLSMSYGQGLYPGVAPYGILWVGPK